MPNAEAMTANLKGEEDKGETDGRGKCRTTLDMGYVTRWKLGPEEAIYHIYEVPLLLLVLGCRIVDRMDGREWKEGKTVAIELCRSRYIVQLYIPYPTMVPLYVTNINHIFS